jgi:hypothetical protein
MTEITRKQLNPSPLKGPCRNMNAMKFAINRPYSDSEATARKLIELAKCGRGRAGRPHPYQAAQRADVVRTKGDTGRI